jgi:hypothetical protein
VYQREEVFVDPKVILMIIVKYCSMPVAIKEYLTDLEFKGCLVRILEGIEKENLKK